MHNLDLILTLTAGLGAALVLGYITHRLGLSPIVGYLLGGVVLGPFTPGFVADRELAEQMANVGVILLMFGVGLHFHLNELLAVRRVAIPGAMTEIPIATTLGTIVGVSLGWGVAGGIMFGLSLSVASTVVLARVLADHRDLHTQTGRIAIGWLIVEDIFTVVALVLLPALLAPNANPAQIPLAILFTALRIGILVAVTLVVGSRVIPWLLEHMAKIGSRELFTLTVLVLALGIAVGSAKLFGVSMALGAFLAGMVVGQSDFSLRAATEALPMRDAFAVLFFVSIGMLFDPTQLVAAPVAVLLTTAIVMIGKPLTAFSIVWLLRYPPRIALGVAISLAQIGEFSFIFSALGRQLDVLPAAASSSLIAASIISITLNPLLYRSIGYIETWASRRPRLWSRLIARSHRYSEGDHAETDIDEPQHRAVIIGYGPVGQTVTRLLRENGIRSTIIEMNLETFRRLRSEGLAAVYGDARHRDILIEAGVERSGSLILSTAGLEGAEDIIRLARELNPNIRILARTAYVREMPGLRTAGADAVYSGEGEVGLAFTTAILRGLGASAEQIDREEERVHTELFGHDERPKSWSPPRAETPTASVEASARRDPRPDTSG